VTKVFETIVKVLLSPLLMAQAVRARKYATRLPEPIGHRSGQFGKGNRLRLLIVGDSSAAGVGVKRQSEALSGQLVQGLSSSHEVYWRLVARTGATTRTAIPLLRAQNPEPTDVAVVVLGINDITGQTPLAQQLRLRRRLYQILSEDWKVKRIVATGIPSIEDFPLLPQPLRWFLGLQANRIDQALERQAKRLGIDYVSFDVPLTEEMMAEDGFHPGSNTYYLMGQKLAQRILHH